MGLRINFYSLAFLAVFFLTVLTILYIKDSWVISIANTLSRPDLHYNPAAYNTMQYHLLKSSQDATKTPACTSLFVISGTVYVYTLYLITSYRFSKSSQRMGQYTLVPL